MRNIWSILFIIGILMVYGAFKFYFGFAKRIESKDPEQNGSKYHVIGTVDNPESNKMAFIQHGVIFFMILFVGGMLLAVFSLLNVFGVKITN